jgi:hypothetical protein
MPDALGIERESVRAPEMKVHGSRARGVLLETITSLENLGLVDAIKVMGPWTVRPTRAGRDRVREWKKQAIERRDRQLAEARRRILDGFGGRGGSPDLVLLARQTGLPLTTLTDARASLEQEGVIRDGVLVPGSGRSEEAVDRRPARREAQLQDEVNRLGPKSRRMIFKYSTTSYVNVVRTYSPLTHISIAQSARAASCSRIGFERPSTRTRP